MESSPTIISPSACQITHRQDWYNNKLTPYLERELLKFGIQAKTVVPPSDHDTYPEDLRHIVYLYNLFWEAYPPESYEDKPQYKPFVRCYRQLDSGTDEQKLKAYETEWITIGNKIGNEADQFVYSGIMHLVSVEIPVVVKWNHAAYSKNGINTSIDMVHKFKSVGIPTHIIYPGFKLWGEDIMVMEQLQPLDKTDKWNDVAKDLLPSLNILHQFAVHSDIKPDNIMKRLKPQQNVTLPIWEYILIDIGDMSTVKEEWGYSRNCHSPNWTSQVCESDQITSWKHDLLELCYTLNSISGADLKDVRLIYRSKSELYIMKKLISKCDERLPPPIGFYDILVMIC
jgi:hypothetical protein